MTLPTPLYYAQYHHLENIHTFHCWKIFFPCTYWHVCNTFFSTLPAAYRVCLGKIFAEILARGTSALPCASCRSMENSASQTMGSSSWPSMVWPLYISAVNGSVHAQHQLYFLSPNCSKLPENFLLSKWIKMATSVSLSPPAWYLQNNSISTICKSFYNGGTLLFPACTPDDFEPHAEWEKIIFKLY